MNPGTTEFRRYAFVSAALFLAAIGFAPGAHAQSGEYDPVLRGALDLHAHLDPDGFGPGGSGRSLDALELARLAREAGMRGFVIKQHYDQTADSAYLVRQIYPDLEIFGGLGTNFPTGGLNPAAVRQMADVKGGYGRIVWMPTWDAEHYVVNHGNDRPFISVSKDGKLLPEAKAVIEAVAEVTGKTRSSAGRVVLATGHNSPEEALMMVEEARRLGVTVLVTHPVLESVGMNLDQMKRAAEMGAWLEFVSGFVREEEMIRATVEAMREVGVDKCIVSSDRGQGRGPEGHESPAPTHLDGLSDAARVLREHGFTERELDMLFKENPARLLGLSGL